MNRDSALGSSVMALAIIAIILAPPAITYAVLQEIGPVTPEAKEFAVKVAVIVGGMLIGAVFAAAANPGNRS